MGAGNWFVYGSVLLAASALVPGCGSEQSGNTAQSGGSSNTAPSGGNGTASGGAPALEGGASSEHAGESSAAAGEQGVGEDCPRESPTGDGVIEGNVVIASAADAEALQTTAEITGDLRVAPSFVGVLELRNLRAVGGSVSIDSPLVMNNTVVDWGRMTELRLPNLTRVGEKLYIYLTNALVQTDFHSLESAKEVYIHRNIALRRVGLDSLVSTASVYFSDNFELARCEVDALCESLPLACDVAGTRADCTCNRQCGRVEPRC